MHIVKIFKKEIVRISVIVMVKGVNICILDIDYKTNNINPQRNYLCVYIYYFKERK